MMKASLTSEAFLCTMTTETRTYLGETGTQAFDGFKGLRLDIRYIGVVQDDGTVLVAVVGAPMGMGVMVRSEEYAKWFTR
jgi:hypothetical protein